MTSPSSSDPALSALLRRADPAAGAELGAPSAAAFAAAVHQRIRSSDTTIHRLAGIASQLFPLAAALAVVASLAAGGSLAYAGAQRERVETHAAAYARTIDPWLMHADRSAETSPAAHVHP